ncbi:MAG: VOC family protein [Acidobacteriota bacterium]
MDDLPKSLDFYQSKLGFEVSHRGGGNGEAPDFWGIVQRDGMMLMLKHVTPDIHPLPNHSRHEWARWDAYVHTSDPDLLYAEFVGRSVPIYSKLANTDDGLRAFEVRDNSGYVLCFGCPQEK